MEWSLSGIATWFAQEILSDRFIAVVVTGGAIMIHALRNRYPRLGEYLMVTGVGLFLSFIGMVLLAGLRLEQQASQERIEAGEKQTAALPRHPHFSFGGSGVSGLLQSGLTVSMSVKNNEGFTDEITTLTVVLDRNLDPRRPPILYDGDTHADPIGPNENLTMYWMIAPGEAVPPAFVVFQVQYVSRQSQERYIQTFFRRFNGDSHPGAQRLFSASREERASIEQYLQYQRISLLEQP